MQNHKETVLDIVKQHGWILMFIKVDLHLKNTAENIIINNMPNYYNELISKRDMTNFKLDDFWMDDGSDWLIHYKDVINKINK